MGCIPGRIGAGQPHDPVDDRPGQRFMRAGVDGLLRDKTRSCQDSHGHGRQGIPKGLNRQVASTSYGGSV
jgi:hypothetical protein